MEIKYRYALNENNSLVDVTILDRLSLNKGARFYSVDYHQELIPRLGTKRRKHFGHKPQNEVLGSKETYLHALGKKVFREEYENCLATKTPFYLEYSIQRTCIRLKESFGIDCRLKDESLKFDLTTYYKEILEEVRDGQFIPDLLLLNPDKQEKIYIEIAVTHLSTDKKIESKIRIIEYYLLDEEDIDTIRMSKNGINPDVAALFNFRQKKDTGILCKDECQHQVFYYFFVASSGKCKMVDDLTDKEIEAERRRNESHRSWDSAEPAVAFESEYYHSLETGDIFRYFIAKAFKAGAKPKNCFLCKYHAENTSFGFDSENRTPIFCKFLKKRCGSNEAASCEYYRVSQDYVASSISHVTSIRNKTTPEM